jgi:hypothetical protein
MLNCAERRVHQMVKNAAAPLHIPPVKLSRLLPRTALMAACMQIPPHPAAPPSAAALLDGVKVGVERPA